jgi:hypothetical protein
VLPGASDCNSVYRHLTLGSDSGESGRSRKTSFYQRREVGFKTGERLTFDVLRFRFGQWIFPLS